MSARLVLLHGTDAALFDEGGPEYETLRLACPRPPRTQCPWGSVVEDEEPVAFLDEGSLNELEAKLNAALEAVSKARGLMGGQQQD
jgi:hypothetical protein